MIFGFTRGFVLRPAGNVGVTKARPCICRGEFKKSAKCGNPTSRKSGHCLPCEMECVYLLKRTSSERK